ncbi:MAG: N-acetylmuramoyl-L-alanine amidase, partial [bacterium]
MIELNYPSHLVVIQRNQWGWQSIPDSLANHQINKITIHHGGVDFSADKDPVEYLCNFQAWCRS